jgi:hypothetical protein
MASVAACAGPRVDVSAIQLGAGAPGVVRVEAVVHNRGGAGEVKATARLRDRTNGAVYVASRAIELEASDSVRVIVDVPAPSGDYAPAVAVSFPP